MKNQSKPMADRSECCKRTLGTKHVGSYGIQYCSSCGRPAEELNRPVLAKMQLVDPGIYEQARETIYGLLQGQQVPKPKPTVPKPKKSYHSRGRSYTNTTSWSEKIQ